MPPKVQLVENKRCPIALCLHNYECAIAGAHRAQSAKPGGCTIASQKIHILQSQVSIYIQQENTPNETKQALQTPICIRDSKSSPYMMLPTSVLAVTSLLAGIRAQIAKPHKMRAVSMIRCMPSFLPHTHPHNPHRPSHPCWGHSP